MLRPLRCAEQVCLAMGVRFTRLRAWSDMFHVAVDASVETARTIL